MKDPTFDIMVAFKSISNGKDTIQRDDLLESLRELDQPHIDILFAKLCARSTGKDVTYASFIETLTPKG